MINSIKNHEIDLFEFYEMDREHLKMVKNSWITLFDLKSDIRIIDLVFTDRDSKKSNCEQNGI